MNGRITAIHGVCAICREGGGAKTHRPGWSGPAPNGVATGAFRPSSARSASISAAAAWPTAIPLAVVRSSGSAAIDAAYLAAKVPPGSPR